MLPKLRNFDKSNKVLCGFSKKKKSLVSLEKQGSKVLQLKL